MGVKGADSEGELLEGSPRVRVRVRVRGRVRVGFLG